MHERRIVCRELAELSAGILDAVEAVNTDQKLHLIKLIEGHYKGDLTGKVFAIWGLAFKPNTDDMREAPSMVIIDELLRRGATVRAFDPVAVGNARSIYNGEARIVFVDDAYEATQDADALVIATEWKPFWSPDFEQLRQQLRDQVIFDGRNIYDPEQVRSKDLSYYSIGRV